MFSQQFIRVASIAIISLISFQDASVAGHASVTWLCEFDCDDGIEEEIERCAELNCEAYTDPECEFDPAGFVETPNLYEWCVENCEAMFGCVIDSCDPPSQENGPKAYCFARDPI